MKNLKYLLLVLILLILNGCGTKRKYFEPMLISSEINYSGTLPSEIIDVTRNGATLRNGQIITKKGLLNVKLPENYIFLNSSRDKYIGVSTCCNLIIIDKSSRPIYRKKFTVSIASASLNNNKLAVLLSDNRVLLVDIKTNEILYEKSGDRVYAHDSNIAAPHFFGSILIFPTLDGKLIIVDLLKQKLIREVIVKSEKFFSNIIYLNVAGDKLIAATKKRIISMSPNSLTFLDEDVKDIKIVDGTILIFTKDGRILLSDTNLNITKTKKFKFASFISATKGELIYVVERGGFLITTNLDFDSTNVYKMPQKINSFLFSSKNKLFYKNSYIELNKKRREL